MIRIRKSTVGADYVYVHMVREDYPQGLLRKQCEAVGTHLGKPIRGLSIERKPLGAGVKGSVLIARFAAYRLIDDKTGILRLVPLAKAFAGAPQLHQVNVLGVVFEGIRPRSGVTIRYDDGTSATVVAHYDEVVPQVEYRVTLKEQDPSKISFPESAQEQTIQAKKPSKKSLPMGLIVGVIGAAVLVGLLVYFALRPNRKGKSASTSRDLR